MELQKLDLSELRKRAKATEVDADELKKTDAADDVETAVIKLIMAKQSEKSLVQLEALLERQAIVIMPVDRSEVDPRDLQDADEGSLTDLVKQWDES